MWKRKIFSIVVALTVIFGVSRLVLAEDTCPPCSNESSCNDRISCLQKQTKSLASQISLVDTQISVTQGQIDSTQVKIDQIDAHIASLSGTIDDFQDRLISVSTVLSRRIMKSYINGYDEPILYLLLSTDFRDLIQRTAYLKIVREHDQKQLILIDTMKKNYESQKVDAETAKKEKELESARLTALKLQLNLQNKQKQRLLSTTQAQLDQAVAQLAAFQSFVQSQGGASLLSGQTKCDDWGCYYNQRDSSWGAMALNHTGYTLADSGCLVTSMAMVATHYGKKDVTPVTINSISDNFAAYFPAFLNRTISAGGTTFRREGISQGDIDGELSAGRPVVVGIGYGPAHFVVLVSGSGGNYTMNDPYVENGSKISFNSKYSMGSITEIDRVTQ